MTTTTRRTPTRRRRRTRVCSLSNASLRGSHGLSARRARRTMSRRPSSYFIIYLDKVRLDQRGKMRVKMVKPVNRYRRP